MSGIDNLTVNERIKLLSLLILKKASHDNRSPSDVAKEVIERFESQGRLHYKAEKSSHKEQACNGSKRGNVANLKNSSNRTRVR